MWCPQRPRPARSSPDAYPFGHDTRSNRGFQPGGQLPQRRELPPRPPVLAIGKARARAPGIDVEFPADSSAWRYLWAVPFPLCAFLIRGNGQMLVLPDSWTWDFWLADDGVRYHVFFLRASRALLVADRRHWRAGIGHAVSRDLREWTLLPDALVHADPPAFDDMATWTGSITRDPSGGWRMFYTGISHGDNGQVQRIGSAHSDDLTTWHRVAAHPLEADSRWYEKRGSNSERYEAWRDPWVFPDAEGNGWHMLITARAKADDMHDRGVIGHATSADLRRWTVRPPLSRPGAGFGHIEVMQVEVVDGRPVIIFSCLRTDMSAGRRADGQSGGIWAAALDTTLGPFDLTTAQPLTSPALYAGRVIRDRAGRWVLLAFQNADSDEAFVGGLSDPIPIHWENSSGGQIRLHAAQYG
jgi:hypothetical protein